MSSALERRLQDARWVGRRGGTVVAGVEALRFGLEALRFGLEALRFGLEALRFGLALAWRISHTVLAGISAS